MAPTAAAHLLITYWYVILTLIISVWGLPPFQVHTTSSGILFERLENILHVPHQAIITTQLNLSIFREEEDKLQNTLEALNHRESVLRGIQSSQPIRLYQDLMQIIQASREQLRSITTILPHRRTKRAWISAGGTVLKTIFGTPDHADAIRWNAELHNALANTQENQATLAYQQVRLAHIEDNLVATTQQLRTTVNQVTHQLDQIRTTINRDVTLTQQKLDNLTTTIASTRTIQILLYNAQDIQLQITKLHTAIQWGLHHNLSPYFIPTPLFQEALHNITVLLKPPAREIYPVKEEYLSLYYAAAQVNLVRRQEILDIEIRIPVTCHMCELECYRLHTFPVPWKAIGHHLLWKTAEILAISTDRHIHTVLSKQELEQCRKTRNYLCSNLTLSTDISACEVALFLAETNASTCHRSVMQLDSPQFITVANSRIYVVPHPITASITCYTSDLIPHTYRVELIGSGILVNSTYCDITTANLKISAQLSYRTVMQSNQFLLRLPETSITVLASSPLERIPPSNHDHLRHSINNLLKQEKGQISLDRAMNHVQQLNAERYNLTVILPSVTLPSTALIVILIISYILYRKGLCKRRHSTNNPVPTERTEGHFSYSTSL